MADNFKLVWTPEGASAREWAFDLGNPEWDLTYATEKATEWPWAEFKVRLLNESAIAIQALMWVLRKRDEPKLDIDSVRPAMADIAFHGKCVNCDEWFDAADDHTCAPKPAKTSKAAKEREPGEA